jgi:hypothetical protein
MTCRLSGKRPDDLARRLFTTLLTPRALSAARLAATLLVRLGTVPPSVTIPRCELTHNSRDSILPTNRSSLNTHCSISLSVMLHTALLVKLNRVPATVGHVELKQVLAITTKCVGGEPASATFVTDSGQHFQKCPCSLAVEFRRDDSSSGLPPCYLPPPDPFPRIQMAAPDGSTASCASSPDSK